MNYTFLIAGREIPVEAEASPDGTMTAAVGGKDVTARFHVVSANQMTIELGGRTVSIFHCQDGDGKLIHVEGIAFQIGRAHV
jgi:hypothetical protein